MEPYSSFETVTLGSFEVLYNRNKIITLRLMFLTTISKTCSLVYRENNNYYKQTFKIKTKPIELQFILNRFPILLGREVLVLFYHC